jgi:S-(hydroxymethyl)glutathione dehydrogenase/alcohol dehydrogenase
MNDRRTPRERGSVTARRPSADDGRTPVRAAVFLGAAEGFRVEELLLDPPGPGEVRVRILASGVCHSDLHVLDGDWDRPAPVVMGHEGAGIVEELGPGVGAGPGDPANDAHPGAARPGERGLEALGPGVGTRTGGPAVGDLVVLAWTAPCGACPACARGEAFLCSDPRGAGHRRAAADVRLRRPDGTAVGVYSGIGTMATHQVVAAEAAIPVDPALPPAEAALLGCAVTTGVGAVTQTAGVRAGETIVVFGLGGVGLSAVMGAVLAGAARVVAVDRVPAKLELARALGATDAVLAGDGPATRAALLRLLPEGADHALEAIGLAATAEMAVEIVRPGGTVTLVGMTPQGVRAGIDVYSFVERGIRLLGSNYGSATPAAAFPELARHAVAGRLPIGRLIEERIDLDDLAPAFEALRRGNGARRVVAFDRSA